MIAIIDYEVGNLRSVEKALQFVGGDPVVTSNINIIEKAEALVLPGVGAFEEAMKKIKRSGTVEVIKAAINQNKPFLGICLGMQLLFDYSEEGNGNIPGLGILSGSVKKFPGDMGLKIPHMGWNCIKQKTKSNLFDGIVEKDYFYFVHSYYIESTDKQLVAATTNYGIEFDAAICKGKVFATQFHPEKSGDAGLRLLKNFVKQIS
jgi:imidazole glycerol-phosphate synthase subunit HisH